MHKEPDSGPFSPVHHELIFRSVLSMGRTAPNPAVACTAETAGRRIFSGGTEKAGKRHAEIVALDCYDSCGIQEKVKKLTVTLEPCSVTGRTPPCTERISLYTDLECMETGTSDPGPAGRGLEILKKNLKKTSSIFTDSPQLKLISETFLRGFLDRITGRGPRFIFKMAVTKDGFMGHKARRIHISGAEALAFGMDLRSKADAVLVGPGTTAIDRPGLDYRSENLNVNEFRYLPYDSACFCSVMSSGAWPSFPAEGDLLSRAVIRFASDIRRLAASAKEYQPDRLFILGRPFELRDEFVKRQERLYHLTGKPAVFLITEKNRKHWRFLQDEGHRTAEIPDLADYGFAVELRRFLGEAGYNDVLIEGGSILYESLRPDIRETDIFYILQSLEITLDQTEGRFIRLPEFIKKMKITDRIPMGQDLLTVRRYVRS